MKRIGEIISLLLAGGILAACSTLGPDGESDVFSQRWAWFSYVNADDIRDRCEPGARPEYRLVYNADFNQQVRNFDVVIVQPDNQPMMHQVIDRGLVFSEAKPIGSIFKPDRNTVELTAEDVVELVSLLDQGGAFGPAPDGLRLREKDHFWIVSGCHAGMFFFNAYRHPQPGLDPILPVMSFIQEHDESGVAWPPIGSTQAAVSTTRCGDGESRSEICFTLTIGEDGLGGGGALF